MTDDLRTRIAAVIAKVVVDNDLDVRHHSLYDMADAVIRELGLRLDSTCHIHDREGKQRCIRYVTEWEVE